MIKSVVACVPNPESDTAKALLDIEKVDQVMPADLENIESIIAAIRDSKATSIWFATDYFSIQKPTRQKEFQAGKNVIDAILECKDQLRHVVFNSLAHSNSCPENVNHIWSKVDIENYLKETLPETITWAILRSATFFEDLDDPLLRNPLKKGYVRYYTKPETKLFYVATLDVGKAAAVLLTEPSKYNGETIEAGICQMSGLELAEVLSEVSGTPCKYAVSMPRLALRLFMNEIYHRANWFESEQYTTEINFTTFKTMVPDPLSAREWFESKGQWGDGEKFVSLTETSEVAGTSSEVTE